MKDKQVFITRQIPRPAIDLLDQHFMIDINVENRSLTHEELIQNIAGKDAILSMLSDRIDGEAMDAAGSECRIIANFAVGYNNIDIKAATYRGIIVTNTPGVLDDATADMAWALLFAVSRRIVEADSLTRSGGFRGWEPMMLLGRDITGKILGVVGAGRIGSNFAYKGLAFHMQILYTDPERNRELESSCNATRVALETLLKESDFVSLHVPLRPETHHLISQKQLAMMKNTAILINTSRGPVIDETALVEALKKAEIWGAGLDVFEQEPKLHPELSKLNNVVIAPHIASATINTRTNMGLIAAKNIISVLNGEPPQTCVNTEVLEKTNH